MGVRRALFQTMTVFIDVEIVIDDWLNGSYPPIESRKYPTAVQMPGATHDIEKNFASGSLYSRPFANSATVGALHTPFVEVTEKARRHPFQFLKFPTAVQLPADAHETDLSPASGALSCELVAKITGVANPHVPFVDVIVNASVFPPEFLKFPTAVQLPADAHETPSTMAVGALC